MSTWTNRIGLALMIGAVVAYGSCAGDLNDGLDSVRLDPDSRAYKQMRDAAFAHAGLPISSQCHRGHPSTDCKIVDHIKPLCLGGKNELDNIQIQPCSDWTGQRCAAGPAFDKDKHFEWPACERVRAGKSTPETEAMKFKREWP